MNIRVTICHSIHYEKPQKMEFFRPGDPFVRADGLNLGSKFEYFLTKESCNRGRGKEESLVVYALLDILIELFHHCENIVWKVRVGAVDYIFGNLITCLCQ